MRVLLRRRERGVAEELLDRAEIRAGLKEVRGKGVPESVRRHVPEHGRLAQRPVQDAADAPIRQARAFRVEEDGLDAPRSFRAERAADDEVRPAPNGTIRSFRPFPRVRSWREDGSTSGMSSATSSPTRSPVA